MHNVRARLLRGTQEWLLSPECKPGMVHLRADMFWQLAHSETQCWSAVIRSYILVESCQVPSVSASATDRARQQHAFFAKQLHRARTRRELALPSSAPSLRTAQ